MSLEQRGAGSEVPALPGGPTPVAGPTAVSRSEGLAAGRDELPLHGSRSSSRTAIVGRETELEALARWLRGPRPALLEIEGEPGIGKTTLWEEATRAAREDGALVLWCRPVEIETTVSFGALATLLEPALAIAADAVPEPRLRALEGALHLRDISIPGLDESAVALGALSLLRATAELHPLVVAVEDVQWLDASSRVALTYALRNLRPVDDVAVLVTRRLGADHGTLNLRGSPLALAAERLEPGPLSLGALHRLISGRLGAPLSRPKLVRVHDASRGNPLHALELARVIADADLHETALAVPASLADALRARLRNLSEPTRTLLLGVAAGGEVHVGLLSRLVERSVETELEEAIASGVLEHREGRVRFSHPLFASTVYTDADEDARSRTHARLAELSDTVEERGRHLALTGGGPDEAVATALEDAAVSSRSRGARGTEAELLEQAAAHTPVDDVAGRDCRLVAAAQAFFQAGESDRARALLEEVSSRTGPLRYEALCHLGTLLDETVGGTSGLEPFEAALSSDDPEIAARAHRGLAQALAYVGSVDRACEHADAAVLAAESLADRTNLVYALAIQALVRKISGHAEWRASLERGLELEADVELDDLDSCPSAFDADTRRLVLDLDGARTAYEPLLRRGIERGDVRAEAWCRFGLATVEIAAGRWDRAAEHTEELYDLAEQTALLRLPALRTAAHLTLLRGDADRAQALLDEVVSEARPGAELLNLRAAYQLQGLLALSLGDARAAVTPLRCAREIAHEMAVGEPGMLVFLFDEVEALAATGDAPGAGEVLATFETCAATCPSPWIAPLVLRGRGVVKAAERDLDGARVVLEDAVAAEDALPLPLERARTRLALGRVLRRLQRRSAAHDALERALTLFDDLGAPLWSERTREELARIGGRAPSPHDLTPTERRIAELVAEGMTNREAAAALFVTPKTIESTLTRVYRKLGIRSRTELARRFTHD